MKIPTYIVDAFTNRLFAGNPAAVCLLPNWLPDTLLQKIASENHLPATAFLVSENKKWSTRWFTPEYEIDLCGHGTLALAYVIFNKLDASITEFELHSPTELLRVKRSNELITLDFPVKEIESLQSTLDLIEEGLGKTPKELYRYKSERCLAVFETEEDIIKLNPNMQVLKKLGYRGIIVTALGKSADFVSRVFYPSKTMSEDAVTGSSYCLLVPYWSKKLRKTQFHARQLSHRGGEVFCELKENRVFISGQAVMYMEGAILISNET